MRAINAEQNNKFLQHFQPDADFAVRQVFEENSVTVSRQNSPHGPTSEFQDMLDTNIEQFYGLTPAVSDLFHDVTVPLMEAGVSLEAVIPEKVVETALSDYADVMSQGFESANVDAYVYTGNVPFALAVFEDAASIGVFDSGGNHVGDLHGTDDALVSWAMGKYKQYRQEARPIADYLEDNTEETPFPQ